MSSVQSLPREMGLWLRAEGAAVAALAFYAYSLTGASWWLLALLALAPDLFMLGYLAGSRIGATTYNIAHSYVAPALLWLVLQWIAPEWSLPLALIWTAHIGVDRALGYGLKFPDSFQHTHLGMIGAARDSGPVQASKGG